MAETTKTRAKKARTTESFDDEPGETLLPDVNVSKASDAELVKTAAITWSNAALREAVVIRFAAMGKAAWPLIERALEIPPFPGSESTSAVVTAISILEAIASADAVARLMTWSKSARCSVAAHSRAALKRLGKKPPARRVEGPSRAQLDTSLATGRPGDKALAIAYLVHHADLDTLPAIRRELVGGAATVRKQAALACGRLGDSSCFGLLLWRLRARGVPPRSGPRAGALPADVADALAAWNGLTNLGDVRAFGEIDRFEKDVRYARLRHLHRDGEDFFEVHPAGKKAKRSG